jgi:hypothetical protein
MKRLIPMIFLLLAACPDGQNNLPMAEASKDTVRERLLRALEENDKKTLSRGDVARAWRSVTDAEWDRWDKNDDDVLDRGEIAAMSEPSDK